MSTASETPTPAPAPSPVARKLRKALWTTVGVVGLVIVMALVVIWTSFTAKAEGLAIGYLQAADSAFQMGRPIPDMIFESGLYRIQAVSQGGTNGVPVVITVYVKDRYLNQTFYSDSRSVGISQAR